MPHATYLTQVMDLHITRLTRVTGFRLTLLNIFMHYLPEVRLRMSIYGRKIYPHRWRAEFKNKHSES